MSLRGVGQHTQYVGNLLKAACDETAERRTRDLLSERHKLVMTEKFDIRRV